MAQTLIGFFEDASDAQRAIHQLESIGISRQNVDLSRGEAGTGTSSMSSGRDSEAGSRNSGGVSGFFNSLFGSDSDEADRYSRVGSSGCSIVTVHAQSREEAERAADLLDEYGAIDVDEKAAQVGYTNTRNETMGTSTGRQNIVNERQQSTEREQSIERIQENL